MSYDWRSFQGRPLLFRFPDSSVGFPQWFSLVDYVLQTPVPDARVLAASPSTRS